MGISRTCPRCGATLISNGAWCANCMGEGTWKCQKCGYTHTPSKAMRCYNCGRPRQTPLREAIERVVEPGFQVPQTTPATSGVLTKVGLQIGEVTRHFDSRTAGQIAGSVLHEFGFHGGAFGMTMGGVGIGAGSLGLAGRSSVNLQIESSTRSDLVNDGFVAVFDEPSPLGITDTVRVVVPSDAACREMLHEVMVAAGAAVIGSLTAGQLSRLAALASSVQSETSYVADRLGAVLRASPNQRPVFSVVGLEVESHTMLGGAIQLPGEDKWTQLFPFGLLRAITPGGGPTQLPPEAG
jgi:hypothetical protein